MKIATLVLLSYCLVACAPKEPVELREVKDITAAWGKETSILRAEAICYNPNASGLTIRHADIDILLDGKLIGKLKQDFNVNVKPKSTFSVPLEVGITTKDIGLMDTFLSLLGGRKRLIEFKGILKVRVHGFPVRVPVSHSQELKF
ncbi:MAG: LEA type 2 family protein [Cyclobacteriaceae bacterium]|nr:LEA type 2 family protein [Cyclobacteriaceae bacterium]